MRMIPCIAGCAGPTPTCRFWGPPPVPLPSPSMNSRRVVCAIALGRWSDERLTPVDRIVLPQGMAHELLVHEQPSQVRMRLEADAEHVPHLALEPVRDRPEGHGGRNAGIVLVHAHLEP